LKKHKNIFSIQTIAAAAIAVMLGIVPFLNAKTEASARNSWRGITPLRSSATDVARVIGAESDSSDMPVGPFKVEGGEVTFSYLTPSLAKIYRAPRAMVGKVFTIYFKPYQPMTRTDLALGAGFKRCQEEREKSHYYYVSSAGIAYQLLRSNDQLETIIYQPSSVEVRSLAVNTECVF
jgi:hypothetical protein